MTERPKHEVGRSGSEFVIGPSHLRWAHDALHISIDELSLPGFNRVKGKIVVRPKSLSSQTWMIDARHQHSWGPLSTDCKIEVDLQQPDLRWSGHAYFDQNEGQKPLNSANNPLRFWNWSRAQLPDGQSVVTYEVQARQESENRLLNLRFDRQGAAIACEAAPLQHASRTAWGIRRPVRSEGSIRVLKTLENTPFYTRNLLAAQLDGSPVSMMHETLDIDRLASIVTQGMLPFKMPRQLG